MSQHRTPGTPTAGAPQAATTGELSPARGAWLGRYQVVRHLARGGMAQILLAREITPDGGERLVVLKRVLPALSEEPKILELFHDEMSLLAALSHHGLPRIYELDTSPTEPQIAMEYIDGVTLRRLLVRRRPEGLPFAQALTIAVRLAETLHSIHEARGDTGMTLSIVHRDLTPENVLLSRAGEVKLIDFGIARSALNRGAVDDGIIRGKYAYLAPEICRGEPFDHRADIFSLGVLLFEAVTGKRLFRRPTGPETLDAICLAPLLRPTELRPELPEAIDAIVLRALMREPEQRYHRAYQLWGDLEDLARRQGITPAAEDLGRLVEGTLEGGKSPGIETTKSGRSPGPPPRAPRESEVRLAPVDRPRLSRGRSRERPSGVRVRQRRKYASADEETEDLEVCVSQQATALAAPRHW